MLEADGLVSQPNPGTWRLTDAGEVLRSDVPGSMAGLASFFAIEPYEAWRGLAGVLRTGEPAFPEQFGEGFWEYLSARPEAGARFDRGMAGTATLRSAPLLERDWSDTRVVVDVGGGNGSLLEAVVAANPGLEGIVVDLPPVAERAAERLAGTAVAGRLRAQAGDFFGSLPSADAYVLAQILHDWDDADATRILRAIRAAAAEGARLLVLEQLVPEGPEPSPVKLLDLQMLVLLGGRERTAAEFETLLAGAGWRLAARRDGPRSSLLEAEAIAG
jgi:hypothetical protein